MNVFDRPGVIDLDGLDVSDGLWAPTIRHHQGIFYVVTTLARNRQGVATLLTTASDPAGPWSDPIHLDAEGIDPSLFFDDDGRCWFTACRDSVEPNASGPGELWMRELDLVAKALIGPTYILWHGAMNGAWVEAPHLDKHDGVYHLIAAEGGTEGNHSVTAARAEAITGPYKGDPRNPLLTHRHLGAGAPIQNVGHADVVETAEGATWAVMLGTRPVAGFHRLGREVILVPAEWSERGLVFAPSVGQVSRIQAGSGVAADQKEDSNRCSNVSKMANPGLEWLSLRGLPPRAHPSGDIVLELREDTLAGVGRPSFLGRRQEHQVFDASVLVDFEPTLDGEEAGLAIHQSATGFATVTLQKTGGERTLVLNVEAGINLVPPIRAVVSPGPIRLFVSSTGLDYEIEYAAPQDSERSHLCIIDGRHLSTERAGGFVGVVLGPYASSNGAPSTARVRFSDFSYAGSSDPTGV